MTDPKPTPQDSLDALTLALRERQGAQLEQLCALVDRAVALSGGDAARALSLAERLRGLRAHAPAAPLTVDPLFATTTMAELLLSQGRPADAAAVYRAVLERDPADATARAGLALCGAAEPAPEPQGMLDQSAPPARYDAPMLRCLPVDPNTVVLFWEVPAGTPGLEDAELALELTTEDGGQHAPEPEQRLVRGIPLVGEYFVRGVLPGATHTARLGAVGSSGFRAWMQARPVVTPRGEPAPATPLAALLPALPLPSVPFAAGAPAEGGLGADGARSEHHAAGLHRGPLGPGGYALAAALRGLEAPRTAGSSWGLLRRSSSHSLLLR